MSRLTVFHPRLAAITDRWMDLFGYAAPAVVSDTLSEYRACRETAALMDFSMLRKVDLEGPGAQALVNSVVCRDVSALGAGRIAYGALTDEAGKMLDDCTVMVRAPTGSASAAQTTRTSGSSRRRLRAARWRFQNAPSGWRTSACRDRAAARSCRG